MTAEWLRELHALDGVLPGMGKSRLMKNRNDRMAADRESGMTYAALGEKYGITPARCGQIMCSYYPEIAKLTGRKVVA